jgi:ParB family transcriptional regulator, chromosome partitioning protein
MVLRDLFDEEHEGYLTNVALLDRLVAEKLNGEAEKLRAEGWQWIEIAADGDYRRFYDLDSIEGEEVPLPKKQRREHDKLAKEYDALVEEHGEDPPEEIAERLEKLSERIDALSTPELRWRPEDIGTSPGRALLSASTMPVASTSCAACCVPRTSQRTPARVRTATSLPCPRSRSFCPTNWSGT